jgi:hypothetical protein
MQVPVLQTGAVLVMRQRLPRLDRIAAMPSKNDPSMVTMLISFPDLHVLLMFSSRKVDSAFIHSVVPKRTISNAP